MIGVRNHDVCIFEVSEPHHWDTDSQWHIVQVNCIHNCLLIILYFPACASNRTTTGVCWQNDLWLIFDLLSWPNFAMFIERDKLHFFEHFFNILQGKEIKILHLFSLNEVLIQSKWCHFSCGRRWDNFNVIKNFSFVLQIWQCANHSYSWMRYQYVINRVDFQDLAYYIKMLLCIGFVDATVKENRNRSHLKQMTVTLSEMYRLRRD